MFGFLHIINFFHLFTSSREVVDSKIEKLVNTRPVSLASTFCKLELLHTERYGHLDPLQRQVVITTLMSESIYRIIAKFFPQFYSQIENEIERRRNNAGPDFDEVSSLIETAITYINKRQVILGADGSDGPQMAAMQMVPQAPALTQQQQQQQPQR